MPSTEHTRRVRVTSSGPPTLDELERLCADARRAHIPGDTVACLGGVPGAGAVVTFTHDWGDPARPTSLADVPPVSDAHWLADVPTEQFEALPHLRPAVRP
jgi:hypothetical protein